MPFKMLISQQNIQHSRLGSTNVLNLTKDSSSFLYLLQEPFNYGGQTRLLDTKHTIIGSSEPDNWAIIYGHSNLHLWRDERFCSKWVSACLWNTHSPKLGEIMLLSVYWSGHDDNLPIKLLEAVEYCNTNGIPYYIAIDSNAHSSLWGDNSPCRRGPIMDFT